MTFSKKLAQLTQDQLFYSPKFPKEHIECLVIRLERLASDEDMWLWLTLVSYGIRRMIAMLRVKFFVTYSAEQVKAVLDKLHERHVLFQSMVKLPKFKWNMLSNKFMADDSVWEKFMAISEVEPSYCWNCYVIYLFYMLIFLCSYGQVVLPPSLVCPYWRATLEWSLCLILRLQVWLRCW